MVLSEELTAALLDGELESHTETVPTWLQNLSRPEDINDVSGDSSRDGSGMTVLNLLERPLILARRAQEDRSIVELCGHRTQGQSTHGTYDNRDRNQHKPGQIEL